MTYLPREGREYFSWAFTGLPDDAGLCEVKIGDAWHPLEMTGSVGRILLAGPDADAAGAIQVLADQTVEVRVTDSPEVVIRGGGTIRIT